MFVVPLALAGAILYRLSRTLSQCVSKVSWRDSGETHWDSASGWRLAQVSCSRRGLLRVRLYLGQPLFEEARPVADSGAPGSRCLCSGEQGDPVKGREGAVEHVVVVHEP